MIAPNIDTDAAQVSARIPTPGNLDELRERFQKNAQEFLAPLFARRDAVLKVVAKEFNIDPAELTRGITTHAALPARRVAVALTIENLCPPFTRDIIADFFKIDDSTLYRFVATLKKRESEDAAFSRRMNALRPRVREAIKLVTEDKSNG